MLRFLTAGESHGPSLSVIIEGLPAGLPITAEEIGDELARRRLGYGRGPRMRFERDEIRITGGVRHGRTLGSPVAIEILNTEWPKWEKVMSADPLPESELKDLARNAPLTRPRPGHADLAGMQKYGFNDVRPILERASARETAARVALGAVAKAFLKQSLGIEILSHVISIGSVSSEFGKPLPGPNDLELIDKDPARVFDKALSEKIIKEIDTAHAEGDTLGDQRCAHTQRNQRTHLPER